MELNFYRGVKLFLLLLIALLLGACGGSSSSSNDDQNIDLPDVTLLTSKYYFRDSDDSIDEIGGTLEMAKVNDNSEQVKSVRLYWSDGYGNKAGEAWLTTLLGDDGKINIPSNSEIPDDVNSFLMHRINTEGEELTPVLIKFHDFIGNAQVSGPGGINDFISSPPNPGTDKTAEGAWYYGGLGTGDRPKISAYRSMMGGGVCVYDNGLVAITDMANGIDPYWKANSSNGKANIINEVDYPPFSFLCDEENPINLSFEVPRIKDDFGAWSYSALNDSMFYGTLVYDTFLKYLGEPPLDDKIRIRAHFGEEYNIAGDTAYWDGVYVNINGVLDMSKMATLDIIAHEVGHGVLSRISHLKAYEKELGLDAQTLHEAFSDMSGVIAKYDFVGKLHWVHGEESRSGRRHLDKIMTESNAIASYLDYADAGTNYYLRIGMITYPFYLLTNKWGLESAYEVMLNAARVCWRSDSTLMHAANCIKQSAASNKLPVADVEDAFKTVKIKLFDTGVLSHFKFKAEKLEVTFMDNSQSDSVVNTWLWEFGDGISSSEANPVHTFNKAGEFLVKLSVIDSNGHKDYFERKITIDNE